MGAQGGRLRAECDAAGGGWPGAFVRGLGEVAWKGVMLSMNHCGLGKDTFHWTEQGASNYAEHSLSDAPGVGTKVDTATLIQNGIHIKQLQQKGEIQDSKALFSNSLGRRCKVLA